MLRNNKLARTISAMPEWALVLTASAASFSTYFCMYAFRKPFAAGSFSEGTAVEIPLVGSALELKTVLVISQIIGYAISKYAGIKICSEVGRASRAVLLVGLIAWAELALLIFAIVPLRFGFIPLFLNGLPLGMVWGLVVLYLEGRRTSELLLATLSCSYIIASGIVKDIGRSLVSAGIDEQWMPFVTGAIFLLPFVLLVWVMDHLPDPDRKDIEMRSERVPMFARERWDFIIKLLPSMAPLLILYVVLTAFRDFRDNYGIEIFDELGYEGAPAIFTRSELPVAIGVMIVFAGLNLIRNNRVGLLVTHLIMLSGIALLAGATLALDAGIISGLAWMIIIGFGAYLAYVPFGSVLFERMMAATKLPGTAVFAIYLSDALGYTGSVGTQLYKDLFAADSSRYEFFKTFTLAMAVLAAVCFIISGLYLWFRTARAHTPEKTAVPNTEP